MCHREREVDEECGCCYVYLCVCQLVSQLGRNVMGVHVSGCACLRGSVCLRACVRRCVLESTVVFKFSLHVDLSQEMKSISIPESRWNRFFMAPGLVEVGEKIPHRKIRSCHIFVASFSVRSAAAASSHPHLNFQHRINLGWNIYRCKDSDLTELNRVGYIFFCPRWENISLDESFRWFWGRDGCFMNNPVASRIRVILLDCYWISGPRPRFNCQWNSNIIWHVFWKKVFNYKVGQLTLSTRPYHWGQKERCFNTELAGGYFKLSIVSSFYGPLIWQSSV